MVSRTERSRLGAKKGRVLTAMLVDRCLDGFPLRARATGAPEGQVVLGVQMNVLLNVMKQLGSVM